MNEIYLNAVRLLLKVAPYVFDSEAFALKGGTAINLEINHVFRGSLRPATLSSMRPAVEDQFLLGLAAAEPDWDLMACPHLGDMPALRWKLRNLENLRTTNRRKFEGQAEQLSSAFDRLDAL